MKDYLKTSGLTLLIFTGIIWSYKIQDENTLAWLCAYIPTFGLLMEVCFVAIKKIKVI